VIPATLAVDFDGVLCDGRPEYFEASCRAYGHAWSPLALGARRDLRARFYRLRPVIMSGWEMPVLVRALARGVPDRRALAAWPVVRETILGSIAMPRDEAVALLRAALDGVRRDWLRAAPETWLAAHRPYVPLPALRRLVARPPRTVVVTTKEGEFARRILDAWRVGVAAVHGKERGEHKCENLRELAADQHGGEVWFVEDRLETLECVAACTPRIPELARVRLYLAAWGYNVPAARARARRHPRIRLLSRSAFARGVAAWPDR
jgi:hypothetical protein